MATNEPSVAPRETSLRRLRWALWLVVLLLAAIATAVYLIARPTTHGVTTMPPASSEAAATWASGVRRAPQFTLRDEHGRPLSLAAFRGRPVIITFIDPACRDYCPTEAKHLTDVVSAFPAAQKPVVVAVSVNVNASGSSLLKLDRRKWGLGPQWHWGVGAASVLANVWKGYHIAVMATTQTTAGVTVHDIAHTEAAYVIDRNGYERALFMWPYKADGVVSTLRRLASS